MCKKCDITFTSKSITYKYMRLVCKTKLTNYAKNSNKSVPLPS